MPILSLRITSHNTSILLTAIEPTHRIFVRAGAVWSRVGTLAVALGVGLGLARDGPPDPTYRLAVALGVGLGHATQDQLSRPGVGPCKG